MRFEDDRTLGRKAVFGHGVTPGPSEFHLRHDSLMDRACISPIRFAEAMARRKAVLTETHLNSARARGSKGVASKERQAPSADPMLGRVVLVGGVTAMLPSGRGRPVRGAPRCHYQPERVERR